MILRDFSPAEPLLQQIIGAGGIVFRSSEIESSVCAVHAILDNGEPVAVLDYVAFDSPVLRQLLITAIEWQEASRLKRILCTVRGREEAQKLEATGLRIETHAAVMSIALPFTSGVSDHVDSRTSVAPESEISPQSTRPYRTKARPHAPVSVRKGKGMEPREPLNVGPHPGVDSD